MLLFLHKTTLGSYYSSDKQTFWQKGQKKTSHSVHFGCKMDVSVDLCFMILKYIDFHIQFIAI